MTTRCPSRPVQRRVLLCWQLVPPSPDSGPRHAPRNPVVVSALPPARPPVYRRVARGATVRRSRVLAASPSLLSHLMSPRVSKSSFLGTTLSSLVDRCAPLKSSWQNRKDPSRLVPQAQPSPSRVSSSGPSRSPSSSRPLLHRALSWRWTRDRRNDAEDTLASASPGTPCRLDGCSR